MSRPQTMPSPSTIFELRSPVVAKRRQNNKTCWNAILFSIALTAVVSSAIITWYQIAALAQFQQQNDALLEKTMKVEPPSPPKPLKFIAVVGMFNSGTTAMWKSIQSNEGIAEEKGIVLRAYATPSGGYPPCGVSLLSDSTVNMHVTMGGNTSGVNEPNPHLFGKYGAMWADWDEDGPFTLEDVLKMPPPHKQDVFYTWWKHTPPQHPVLACFRPDTLYVVMVRHPKAWKKSTRRKRYDFKYEPLLKLWRLVRNNPRRMPPLEIRFRSLFNAWEYYMRGYTSWETVSSGKNCYNTGSGSSDSTNCLGGDNQIQQDKRNIVLVRYEDYLLQPKRVLAEIFSFATFGLINAKTEEEKFVPFEAEKIESSKEMLKNLIDEKFFSVESSHEWEGATYLEELCTQLGYSCDETNRIFQQPS